MFNSLVMVMIGLGMVFGGFIYDTITNNSIPTMVGTAGLVIGGTITAIGSVIGFYQSLREKTIKELEKENK